MRQAAEHDVRHSLELLLGRFVQLRMVVAVNGRPPRRHAVDQLSSVGELDAYAFGPDRMEYSERVAHRRVRVPQMLPVVGKNLFCLPFCLCLYVHIIYARLLVFTLLPALVWTSQILILNQSMLTDDPLHLMTDLHRS